MTSPTKINQITEGLERLITQWQDKPNVVGLFTSYLDSINELEDVYFQLLEERSLDTAIGAQLDNIGLIVGEPRDGRSDNDYRDGISLRVAINASDGTEPRVVELLKLLSGAETAVYQENFPAGVIIKLEGPETSVSQTVLDELKNILGATITAELSFVTFMDPPFVFEGDSTGEGFADVSTNSEFQLVTDTGFNIGLSNGGTLVVFNENIALDPDTFPGGFLSDNITVTV